MDIHFNTLKKYALSGFLLLIVAITQAQPIRININVMPPVTNDITKMIDDPNKVLITISNTTAQDYTLKLHVSITGDNGTWAKTKDDYVPLIPLKISGFETKVMNLTEFEGFGREGDVEYGGVDKEKILRTRKVPEGNYTVCVEAYDYNSPGKTVPLSSGFPTGCAMNLQLTTLDPPQIVSVGNQSCGAVLTPQTPQMVNITWLPPAGLKSIISYQLQMVEVYPSNREVNDAIFSNSAPYFIDETTNANVFNITNIQQQLRLGAKYAFRVRAIDSDSSLVFRNNGYSQVCVFTYGSEPSFSNANFSNTIHFPVFGDTIPFAKIPIICSWNPYASDLSVINNQVSFEFNNIPTIQNNYRYTFNTDPISYGQARNFGQPINQTEAKMMVLPIVPDIGNAQFEIKGRTYDVEINSEFTILNNPVTQNVIQNTRYTYGMPQPQLQSPAMNAVMDEGSVNFRIHTCATCPQNILRQTTYQGLGNSQRMYDYNIQTQVNEVMVFELSNNLNFNTLVNRQVVRLNYTAAATEIKNLYDSVFKQMTFNVQNLTNGIYYWRIKYLTNPNDTSTTSAAYLTSPYGKINIGRYINEETTPCVASGCEIDPLTINQTRRAPRMARSFKMANFDLYVTQISDSTNQRYTGEAITFINPFPNSANEPSKFVPIKVAFQNIEINAQNIAFAGTANTINSNNSNVWNAVSTGQVPNNSASLSNLLSNGQTEAPTFTAPNFNNQNGVNTPFFIPIFKHQLQYQFTVLGISFTPYKANMNCAYEGYGIKENKHYTFMANNVCVKPSGLSTEVLELNLIDNIQFDFFENNIFIEGYTNNVAKTKAIWDCSGFRHIHLEGNVTFNKTLAKPSEYNQSNDRLVAYFSTQIVSFTDYIISAVINQSYHIIPLETLMTFGAGNVIIDNSDRYNPMEMRKPAHFIGDLDATWNGVYFPELNARVNLEPFVSFNITGTNIFWSDGLNGNFIKTNFEDRLNIGFFNLDIDTFKIEYVQGRSDYTYWNGNIRTPFDENVEFPYTASISEPNNNGKSSFSIVAELGQYRNNRLALPFSGFIQFDRTSRILINKDTNNHWSGRMLIDGSYDLNVNFENIGPIDMRAMQVQGMSFNFGIANTSFFNAGTWRLASPTKTIAGYAVNLLGVEEINAPNNVFGLNFLYNMGLGDAASAFSVTGNLALNARWQEVNDRIEILTAPIAFDSLSINGEISVARVQGKLYFFNNHPVYGNGLGGLLATRFEPGIEAIAQAYFGKKSNFNYWGIYAGVNLNNAPVPLGAIECNGFAGGVFYNMKNQSAGPSSNARQVINPTVNNLQINIVPESNVFSFSAKVWLQSIGGGDAFKSISTLSATFSNNFSLRSINFSGNMWVMPSGTSEVPVWADLELGFNRSDKKFNGTFNGYIQTTGIRGKHTGNRAGTVSMMISPNRWYLYVGQPNDRIGVTIFDNIEVNAYMCIGSFVPSMPDLPSEIKNVLRSSSINTSNQRNNDISRGKGFVFGAFFRYNPPPTTFLALKGDLDLMLGFDLSLIKKEDASCNNLTRFGMNNWYAQGQLYAYLKASLSLHVDVWFAEGNFNIFSAEVGAALAGGTPNPTWATGALAGRYRILGGAIKGRFNFDFTVGNVCRPTSNPESPVAALKIIESVSVANNETNFSPFGNFDAILNFKPGQDFSIELMNDEGETYFRRFKAKLTYQLIGANNTARSTNNATNNIFSAEDSFYNINILPAYAMDQNQVHFLKFKEWFEERKNNRWDTAVKKDGTKVIANSQYRFTTGAYPDRIEQQLITSQYPENLQQFAKVKLNASQGYAGDAARFEINFLQNLNNVFFYDSANHTYKNPFTNRFENAKVKVEYILRLTNIENNSTRDYNIIRQANKIVVLNLPSILTLNTRYKAQVIRKKIIPVLQQLNDVNNRLTFAQNSTSTYNRQNYSIEKRTIQIQAVNSAQTVEAEEFTLYELYFKTSKYESIFAKMNTQTLLRNTRDAGAKLLTFDFRSAERFDWYEMEKEIVIADFYEYSKRFFEQSEKQYEVLNMLQSKVNLARKTNALANINSLYLNNAPNLGADGGGIRNLKLFNLTGSSTGVIPKGNVQSFLNQRAEPSNATVEFTSAYELWVYLDRPTISNYCAAYLMLLNNLVITDPAQTQLRLTNQERSKVQQIIHNSAPQRTGFTDMDGSYTPDQTQYQFQWILLNNGFPNGANRRITYRLN